MITGYDPSSKVLTTGIGNLIDFVRLIRNRSEHKALILTGRRFTKYPYSGLLP